MWRDVTVAFDLSSLSTRDLFRVLAACDFHSALEPVWGDDGVAVGDLDDVAMVRLCSDIKGLGIPGVSVQGSPVESPRSEGVKP